MQSWPELSPRDFNARLLQIRHERPSDAAVVLRLTQLLIQADPPKTLFYQLCAGHEPIVPLCYVVEAQGEVVASLRAWSVMIGHDTPAVLLGPLAVDPDHLRQGLGGWLMRHTLDRVYRMQHHIALVWGEADFHERFGFSVDATHAIDVCTKTSSGRLLGLELTPGALRHAHGRLSLTIERMPKAYEEDLSTFSYFSFRDEDSKHHS